MANRIIFMGTPEFAVPSLESLLDCSCEVVAVCTQPDRQAGRGREMTASPVKELALSRGLKIIQPESLKDRFVLEQIADIAPDLIVVAAYGNIIPQEILVLPKFGCINVHPSLLPRYRGSSPIVTAILKGDEVTGVTIMLLDAGVDSGPILRQVRAPVSDEDTTGSLTARLAEVGANLLEEVLPLWFGGRIKPVPQDGGQATYTKTITKKDGEIDWQLTASELWHHVRAFDPWPGCYTWWQGKQLRVKQVVPLPDMKAGQAGKVIALPRSAPVAFGVECGEGVLGLLRVQLEGKREIAVEEFVRGRRDFVNSFLP